MPFEISVGKTKRKMHVCVIDNEDFICLGQSFLRGLGYRFDNSKNSIFVSKNAAKTQRLMAQDAGPMKWTNVPATVYGGYSVIGQDFFGDRHFVIDHEKRVIRFSRR
jgi:hypothetical protein